MKTKNVQYQNSNLIFALGVDWAIISFTKVGKGENLIIETFRGTEKFCETVIWNFLAFLKRFRPKLHPNLRRFTFWILFFHHKEAKYVKQDVPVLIFSIFPILIIFEV